MLYLLRHGSRNPHVLRLAGTTYRKQQFRIPCRVVLNAVRVSSSKTGPSTDVQKKPEQAPQPLGPVVSRLPVKWIPYAQLMRIEKPVGTWLLFEPGAWAITMAACMTSASLPHTLYTIGLFGLGSFIMRGAGCTINDYWDRRLDASVERTANRPMASGQVSVKQATIFLGGQLTAGLAILLSLPLDCFMLGASSLLFVATYPLFKRFTYYPQLMLSLTFNWGALLGFPAMGVWDWSVMLPLYLTGVNWCMIYDTIYAHQDKRDDILIGIKSTALKWGDKSKPILSVLGFTQMGLLTTAFYNAGMLFGPGVLFGVGIMGYRLARMIYKVNLDSPKDCWKWFVNNISTGNYLLAGIAFDYLSKIFGLF